MLAACGLCREIRELRDSHVLPAAVYKLCRNADENPNPVLTTRQGVLVSSQQVTAHFLCEDCEARFSECGERYVLKHVARRTGEFRFREMIERAEPAHRLEQLAVYHVAALPDFQCDQIIYFAASVFWRAAARRWKLGKQELAIDLGPKYLERFRRYLLGDTPFPSAARMFVQIWSDPQIHFMATFPNSERIDSVWRHKFVIPGLTFILFVGNDAPSKMDIGAINSSTNSSIWLTRWEADSLFRLSGEMMMSSPVKSPKLLRGRST